VFSRRGTDPHVVAEVMLRFLRELREPLLGGSKLYDGLLAAGKAGGLSGAKNGIFFGVFPMFVPSLSWQNDRFYI
jgi:hypothetical protein